ncbi:dynein heavy chain 5, axonemal-like isoform X1 [Patiria miniata]|uniref:Dynein heavy chain n=1 Tax=Patiria miniata TaxID=46514 RepID=A0A914B2Q7_PATMI|nr:dynein heavy chain 5, axonemal-like isoform X1 [Patiria miniata]
MADVEAGKTAANGPTAGPPGHHRVKATAKRNPGSADPKNKSRLAALAPGENLKERQQKLKEEKEAKRAHLDSRHEFIIDATAASLSLDKTEVEDAILEGNTIEKMDKFFDSEASSHLMFFYQEMDMSQETGGKHPWIQDGGTGEPMRLGPASVKSGKTGKPKLFVTDGVDAPLCGICVFFLRANPSKPITAENVHKDLIFTSLDTGRIGLLQAIERYLGDIFLPFLKGNQNGWGQLGSQANQGTRKEFVQSLDAFVTILNAAQDSLEERVELRKCETYDLSKLTKASDYITVANSTQELELIEGIMAVWIKQIEQVLTESEQMRKEADNIGPRAELEHWKKRMARFNYLLEQLKKPEVKAVLGVLQAAKSRSIKTWMDLDRRITDAANEAKDNVKFLYTLDKFCDPLYNSDPIGMIETIPGLINAIRMIHSISRFYNTSERMTSLFVKVTNQMITSCKAYISERGTMNVWDQPTEELIPKLKACIHLNHEYQRHFQRTKQKLETMPNERQFEFSEMYIFGKFDTFERRLQKIIDMFDTMEMYSHLAETRIEGMEIMANKFVVIYTSMKKKPYDLLDQRKTDYDNDYQDFKRSIGELQAQIKAFMDATFDKIYNVPRALQLIKKFERITITGLGITERYALILSRFGREIENTSRNYQRHKNEPPVARDLPPIAGKITWARQMFQRIQEPMEVFQTMPHLLQGAEAKRIIKNYNKLAKVLMEFEVLYHRAWLRQVEAIKSGLHASLLVSHPETNELFVNFDPQILTLIRETECMSRLGLDIPLAARAIRQKQGTFKENFNKLQLLMEENKRVRAKIHPVFEPLMLPHINKLDNVIEPGLTMLSWTSMNIDSYVESVYKSLGELELLMDRANDLCQFRINAVLLDMSTTPLCELPEDEPWTIDQFLQNTQDLCNRGAITIQNKSTQVEEAANEVINMLMSFEEEKEEEEEDEEEKEKDVTEENGEKRHTSPTPSRLSARSTSRSLGSGGRSRAHSAAAMNVAKRKREMQENLEEVAQELLAHFNHRNLDALLKVTRQTLDSIRKRVTSSSHMSYIDLQRSDIQKKDSPFFRCNVTLSIPNIIMQPALDEVQQAVNKAAQLILGVAKGVAQWNKERKSKAKQEADLRAIALGDQGRRSSISSMAASESSRSDIVSRKGGRPEDTPVQAITPQIPVKNYFKSVSENKEIAKLVSLLSTCVNSTKKEVTTALERFAHYHPIWQKERSEMLEEFLAAGPKLSDFQAMLVHYSDLEAQITAEPEFYNVGAIALFTENLKLALTTETHAWQLAYSRACNDKYRTMMEEIFDFIDEVSKRLNRPIKDLDDIRLVMQSLKEVRVNEIRIDMEIGPIEESYALLNKYELLIAKEDAEKVDTLRYSWERVAAQSIEMSHHLLQIQPDFRGGLLSDVQDFISDCGDFYGDYHDSGPMVTGIPPKEASDRLVIYQNRFDTLYRKYITYTGGEELFGLSVTDYPELLQIKKELNLLQKLYGLYNDVIDRVNGYYDILWVDVDIEKINQELIEFQNRCRKLPRALKEWPAFNDLKNTIDDFNETCPLLELMTNKAMKPRHWQRMAETTGHVFDVESETFCLRNIMEAPLLQSKEDIEDICISAVKEKDIEAKLKATIAEWSAREIIFANFKNRGELLLRGDNITEVISFMEDSLMVLGSLLSNR